MALTNEELQEIISGLSPEERKRLQEQLGIQINIDNITDITDTTTPDKPSLFGIVCQLKNRL